MWLTKHQEIIYVLILLTDELNGNGNEMNLYAKSYIELCDGPIIQLINDPFFFIG